MTHRLRLMEYVSGMSHKGCLILFDSDNSFWFVTVRHRRMLVSHMTSKVIGTHALKKLNVTKTISTGSPEMLTGNNRWKSRSSIREQVWKSDLLRNCLERMRWLFIPCGALALENIFQTWISKSDPLYRGYHIEYTGVRWLILPCNRIIDKHVGRDSDAAYDVFWFLLFLKMIVLEHCSVHDTNCKTFHGFRLFSTLSPHYRV